MFDIYKVFILKVFLLKIDEYFTFLLLFFNKKTENDLVKFSSKIISKVNQRLNNYFFTKKNIYNFNYV